MEAKPPYGEPAHIKFRAVVKREEDICQAFVFKGIDIFKFRSVKQQFFLGEQTVDSVQLFLQIAAAALQNKSAAVFHLAKIPRIDFFNAHSCIPLNS